MRISDWSSDVCSSDLFQHFDLLLVFQADVLLAGDGAAIDFVAAGRIQGEAAHLKVFVDRKSVV